MTIEPWLERLIRNELGRLRRLARTPALRSSADAVVIGDGPAPAPAAAFGGGHDGQVGAPAEPDERRSR
jgi:hypothetical protein